MAKSLQRSAAEQPFAFDTHSMEDGRQETLPGFGPTETGQVEVHRPHHIGPEQQQISRIRDMLGASEPVGSAEPSPQLLELRAKDRAALSKKEKKLLKQLEHEEDLRLEQRREEAAHTERQRAEETHAERQHTEEAAHAERQRREEAARVEQEREQERRAEARRARDQEEERQRKETRDKVLEEGSLKPLEDFVKQRDMDTAKLALFDMADKLVAVTGMQEYYKIPTDFAQNLKSYHVVIADHVRDPKLALELFREVAAIGKRFEDMQRQGTVARIVNRELQRVMVEEFEDDMLQRAATQIADDFEKAGDARRAEFHEFELKLAQVLWVPVTDASANIFSLRRDKFDYAKRGEVENLERRAQQIAEEQNINEDAALEEAVKERIKERNERARSGPFTLETLAFREEDSAVADQNRESLLADGGAFRHLSAGEAEARKIEADANGFLYREEQTDDTYALKPTLPETVSFTDEGGKKVNLDLRKSYNRMTRMIAQILVDGKGGIAADARQKSLPVSDASGMVGSRLSDCEEFVRETFADQLKSADILNGEPEEAVVKGIAILIQKGLVGSELGRNVTGFPDLMEKCFEYAENPWETHKKCETYLLDHFAELQIEGETSEDYEALIKATINRIPGMFAALADSIEEMRALRDLDTGSRDVFLPGTCTSNARTLANVARLQGLPAEEIQYETPGAALPENIFLQRKDYIVNKLHELTGKEESEFAALSDAQLLDECGKYVTYDSHVAPHIGDTADGAYLTMETFAATPAEMSTAPFTRKIYTGVYRGDADGFRRYQNRNDAAMLERTDLLILALKQAELL